MTSNRGYAAEAASLVARYEALTFAQVHRDLLAFYPPPPCRVLDIGAGTGRDAAALAGAGYEVWAAEPTAELREAGKRLHSTMPIRWVDDALPYLAAVSSQGTEFHLVLLTAVWMHLDADERKRGMPVLRQLLEPHGRVAMTLRHGPVPVGRQMFDVTGGETIQMAKEHGFAVAYHGTRGDAQSRPDVSWTCLVLEAQ